MTRQEAIIEACEIIALAYHSIGDFSQASDGFCEKCPSARMEKLEAARTGGEYQGLNPYRNEGQALDYVRKAVLAALKKDGYAIDPGFDPLTGKPRSNAESTETPALPPVRESQE